MHGTTSLEKIARLFNLDPRRIQQLANEGVVKKAGRGQYKLVESIHGYIKYLQSRAEGQHDQSIDGLKEKARLTKHQADIAAMQAEQMRSDLVSASEVSKTAFEFGRAVRDSLQRIPDRIAPMAAAESDPHKVHTLISGEIHNVLEVLKNKEIEFEVEKKNDIEL